MIDYCAMNPSLWLARIILRKTWSDGVKNDMESLDLSQKDAQFGNKWRRRIKGATG